MLPRRGRSGLCWGAGPLAGALLAGEGMSSALNSSAVNRSHSREREKCGAWLCRRASEVASATRPCAKKLWGWASSHTESQDAALNLVHLTYEATGVRRDVPKGPQKEPHDFQQPCCLCRWQGRLLHMAALSKKQVSINHIALFTTSRVSSFGI